METALSRKLVTALGSSWSVVTALSRSTSGDCPGTSLHTIGKNQIQKSLHLPKSQYTSSRKTLKKNVPLIKLMVQKKISCNKPTIDEEDSRSTVNKLETALDQVSA